MVAALHSDPVEGLTEPEAVERLAGSGRNVVPAGPVVSPLETVLSQLRDPLVLVLLGAAGLTAALRDAADTVVILLVVAVNTAIGTAQARRARRDIEALQALAAPTARVRRDGRPVELPAAQVVPGDVLLLAEGDVVAADARLLSADDLEVDESLLTGESLPSPRTVDAVDVSAVTAERRCLVHGGTLVVHGQGSAVVTATGTGTAIGGLSQLLHRTASPATPLQRRLGRLGRQLSVGVALACLLVAGLELAAGKDWGLVVVTAVSLAVAAVPESLPAVVALSLAAGARRMARRGAIVRSLPAVEALGSVTVLATDKTGTLTTGRMRLVAAWTPDGGVWEAGNPADAGALELMRLATLCSDAELQGGGDPTEVALVTGAAGAGLEVVGARAACPRVAVVPFDAQRRDMSSVHVDPGGRRFTITKGAPDVVLADDERLGREVSAGWAREGRRVLAVVVRSGDAPPTTTGLLAVADPVREEAGPALRACREAGITPVLVTGDHPGTAAAVARRTGVLDDVRSGPLPGPAPEERVRARIDPGGKLDLVAGWQRDGHVVAMTGDGVNDAPALRAADVGVAMGRRGTDVAREAADIVLTDDSLATIVRAVAEGRRVYDNIRRFLRYGLAGGIAEVLVMLAGPLLGLALPLLPAQILWINLLTHGLPGVAIGQERREPDVLARPPRRPDAALLGHRLAAEIGVLAAVLALSSICAAWLTHARGGPWQSVLFATLALGQLGVALCTRSDHVAVWRLSPWGNPMLLGAVLLSAVLVVAGLYVPPLQALLGTVPLTAAQWGLTLGAATAPAVVAQLGVALAGLRRTG